MIQEADAFAIAIAAEADDDNDKVKAVCAAFNELVYTTTLERRVLEIELDVAIDISIFDYRAFMDVLHKAQDLEEAALKSYTSYNVLGNLSGSTDLHELSDSESYYNYDSDSGQIAQNDLVTFTDIAAEYRFVASAHADFMLLLDGEFGAYSEPIFDEAFGYLVNAITIAKDMSTKSGEW